MPNGIYDPALYVDPLKVFFPAFFPHIMQQRLENGSTITHASPPFHHEIIDKLKEQNKRTVILAPRGSAKSTLITFMWIIYCSVYGISPFTVLVSDTHKKAVSFMMRIRRELEANDFLRETFKITRGVPWSQDDMAFNVGWLNDMRVRIVARGAGQSLRGYVENVRPTLVVLDDVESDENTATEERREKLRNWFYGQILPALDPIVGKMVFVGTIVHADALLARLEQNPPKGWTIMKYVIEKDGVPLWPERLPMEEIMRIKDEYMLQGALPNFYMEYYNDPTGREKKIFDLNNLRTYNPFDLNGELRHYMAVDFGASLENEADYTVVMVGGVDNMGNLFIREYVRERMHPTDTLSTIFDLYNKYNCLEVGIETNGPQKVYFYMLDEASRSRGNFLRIHNINQRIDKDQRILAIQPKMDAGQLFILPTMKEIYEEMRTFPKGAHDDVLDALSNLLIVLTKNKATSPRRSDFFSNVTVPAVNTGGQIFMP